MTFKKWIVKKRLIWHRHFLPSLLAAVIVGILSFLFDLTIENIILFASVGASATILTNSKSHHLTKLRTTIAAYLISIIISSTVFSINYFIPIHFSLNLIILIFFVGILLYLFDAFHPPAITASISFIILERPWIELLYLFIAIILLLTIARFITYIFSQDLSIKEFWKEFKRNF